MMTFAEAEITFINQLKSVYDGAEAKEIAFHILHYLTGVSKSRFLLNKQQQISEEHEKSMLDIVEQLKSGKPLQYIIGETEFYGLTFKVGPSVLIPRPETEELVDWILNEVRSLRSDAGNSDLRPQTSNFTILDIGTGSGCIAISLKNHLSEAEVYALDKFEDALGIAKANAVLNKTEINFIQADVLLEATFIPDVPYSIIVSNPPYITLGEKKEMHRNVLDHEPHSALFVANESPLIFYDRIADFASKYLVDYGFLFFEINESFGKEIVELLQKNGFYDIDLKKDLQGKHRMVKARFKR